MNGSSDGQFPDITTGSIRENGVPVSTLSIPAWSEYNETEVVYWALFDTSPKEVTPPATLTIIAALAGLLI